MTITARIAMIEAAIADLEAQLATLKALQRAVGNHRRAKRD
jgi:uncharacterized small protein (DUF1192 family)